MNTVNKTTINMLCLHIVPIQHYLEKSLCEENLLCGFGYFPFQNSSGLRHDIMYRQKCFLYRRKTISQLLEWIKQSKWGITWQTTKEILSAHPWWEKKRRNGISQRSGTEADLFCFHCLGGNSPTLLLKYESPPAFPCSHVIPPPRPNTPRNVVWQRPLLGSLWE